MTRDKKHISSKSAHAQSAGHDQNKTENDGAIAMDGAGCHAEFIADNDELIGEALKSVYRQTVDEALPSEFQDLLDKLA
ncbi:MAG: NepR family anti-sigma factor [Pseudomonadota bacterium]